MDTNSIKEKLLAKFSQKNIFENESMAKHTSFKCGGNSALFVIVDNLDELSFALEVLKESCCEFMIIGNGTNCLFADDGYDGVVLKLGKEFSEIIVLGDEIVAGAGASLPYLANVCAANGLCGLEFACGIPGSLGGAIFMNAGAYDGSMKDVLYSVTAINFEGEIYEYEKDELDLSYRHSRFEQSGEIILSAKLKLEALDASVDSDADLGKGTARENATYQIQAKMDEFTRRRKEKQPLNYPSAGSFFKRPEGGYAAELIEKARLKGKTVGGASVSTLHSGFIINTGNATASDVIELAKEVSDTVEKKFGIRLSPEVRIIGK